MLIACRLTCGLHSPLEYTDVYGTTRARGNCRERLRDSQDYNTQDYLLEELWNMLNGLSVKPGRSRRVGKYQH